jgi:hypothetical protein
MRTSLLICCLLLVAACGQGSVRIPSGKPSGNGAPANAPLGTEPTANDEVAAMRKDIAAIMARPERTAREVQVQHILIGRSNPRLPQVSRSDAEAEVRAAEVYAKIKGGADFGSLVAEFTDDSAPGIYTMMQTGTPAAPGAFTRDGMARAFGDVGWRLDVGEVGVAPYHDSDSPFGWHIIKRLK